LVHQAVVVDIAVPMFNESPRESALAAVQPAGIPNAPTLTVLGWSRQFQEVGSHNTGPRVVEGWSRMHAVELVFAIGWAAFWIYWLVAAFSMKKGRILWSRDLRIRVAIVVLVVVLLRLGAFRRSGINADPWRVGLGLFLFALGLGFAILARLHIGRNWGTPMSQKDQPELVTNGPYRLVRHPIYSGILLAVLGTAVALSWLFLVALVLVGVYFTYSATIEERYLNEQFPDTYPVYRRSTKMFVPFIF
jgi:protein-S-isoprenylcysteine O-methyltransferase Ste14